MTKITREVREFAASAANSGHPGDGRDLELGTFARGEPLVDRPGDSLPARTREFALGEAEAGMAEMSERFKEKGGEIRKV